MSNADEYKILTIREYSQAFDLPEPTVRSRIRLKKINTVPHLVEGKEVHGIRVRTRDLLNDDQTDQKRTGSSLLNHQIAHLSSSQIIKADNQQMITDRDTEIKRLQEALSDEREAHKEEIEGLRKELQGSIDQLRKELESERIKNAKLEGELSKIPTVEMLVDTQKETIHSQKTAIEALNNERIVITQQLQKYRSNDEHKNPSSDKVPGWMFWKR